VKRVRKVSVGVLVAVVFALAVIVMLPQLAPTSYGSFDINSGKRKFEWRLFGLVYKVRVDETDYSKLLQRIGLSGTNTEWKVCSETRAGILSKDYIDYEYGRIASDAERLAAMLDVNSTNTVEARKVIQGFQALAVKGDSAAMQQYLVKVQTTADNPLLRRD